MADFAQKMITPVPGATGIIAGTGMGKLLGGKKRIAINRFGFVNKTRGESQGMPFIFIPRHNRKFPFLPERQLAPLQVNYRANIYHLCRKAHNVISVTAVGSVNPKYPVGTIVFPSDFAMPDCGGPTFFENFKPHKPMHAGMNEPYSPGLVRMLALAGFLPRLGRFDFKNSFMSIPSHRFPVLSIWRTGF